METLCLPVGLREYGLLDLSAKDGRSIDSSSELTLISSGVFSCGSTAGCSTTTLCLTARYQQRGMVRKVEAALEPGATGLPVPGHLGMQSVARCLRRAIGNTRFLRNCYIWPTVFFFFFFRLAPYDMFIFNQRWRLSLFHSQDKCPFLHIINRKIALLVNLTSEQL